uniref:acylglycerol lipase n=1 Tax=Fopius arisanus TaxID=64838 RepID=A0A0C9R311_9HYME
METETNEGGEQLSSPCCFKVFEYLRNRNRIGPGRVELPECDFFIVETRRTLRVLRPTPKTSGFYELPCERPESIHENFISRWTKRPHSSGNCRCSFRQSSRFSTNEECMITAEINRIRTSLCEAEKKGYNIDEIEKRISMNLSSLSSPITTEPRSQVDLKLAEIANVGPVTGNRNADDLAIKNKIVKDLEKYIDVLLEEVLNDSMKFINCADDTLRKSRKVLEGDEDTNSKKPLDISFAFPSDLPQELSVYSNVETRGYVNESFVGTVNDPDCLDFDLRKPIDEDLAKLDCVDSGINSVETVEFQPEPELSLEQSLMEIIDAKFGPGPLGKSQENEDTDGVGENEEERQENNSKLPNINIRMGGALSSVDGESDKSVILESLDDPIIDMKFDDCRLELKDSRASTLKEDPAKKQNAVAVFCEKFTSKISNSCKNRDSKSPSSGKKSEQEPVEMRDHRTTMKRRLQSPPVLEHPDNNSVMFRRHRKPIIVFIHGFGSSADVFEPQLAYFTQMGYPCIAPEMLGHGMSSAPTRSVDYHFDRLLKDFEAVLQHYAFKPGYKCVLVAHNYGCSFATALAAKYEKEIHQLVLISGGGPTPLAPPSREGTGHLCLRAMLSPLLMCGAHRDILYSPRGRQHPYCGNETEEQWPSHMRYILDGMIWPEGDYVFHRRICTPTLLIHGLRDNKVSLVQECQMERTVMKAFLEALPTAGHLPMIETPEQVNHMIHCFIDLWTKRKW